MIRNVKDVTALLDRRFGSATGRPLSLLRTGVWVLVGFYLIGVLIPAPGVNLNRTYYNRKLPTTAVRDVVLDKNDPRGWKHPKKDPNAFTIAWVGTSTLQNVPPGRYSFIPSDVRNKIPTIDGKPVHVEMYLFEGGRSMDVFAAVQDALASKPDLLMVDLNPLWLFNDRAIVGWPNLNPAVFDDMVKDPSTWPLLASLYTPSDAALGTASRKLASIRDRWSYAQRLHEWLDDLTPLTLPNATSASRAQPTGLDRVAALPNPLEFWNLYRPVAPVGHVIELQEAFMKEAQTDGSVLNDDVVDSMMSALADSHIPTIAYMPPLRPASLAKPGVASALHKVEDHLHEIADRHKANTLSVRWRSAIVDVPTVRFKDMVHMSFSAPWSAFLATTICAHLTSLDAKTTCTPKSEDDSMNRPRLELTNRVPRYVAEMLIGLVLAGLIVLALIATVGSVPFIYQGYWLMHVSGLHHIGYVVPRMEAALSRWVAEGAVVEVEPVDDPIQRVTVALLRIEGDVPIELVSPISGMDSMVAARLRRGGGLDHLCFVVDDVAVALDEEKERGGLVVGEPAYAVAFGRTVGFVMRRSRMVVEYISELGVSVTGHVPDRVAELVKVVVADFPVHEAFLTTALNSATDGELSRLSDYLAFCESKGLDTAYLAESYLTTVCDIVDEQRYFGEHGHYRHSTFAEVADSVYHDADYMNLYMYGLAISTFLWPNHVAMARMFRDAIPRSGGGRYLEVGPGHGFLLLTAAEVGGYDEFLAVDVSEASVRQTETIVRHFHPDRNVQVRNADFLDAADLRPRSFDAIVMGEVIEHVEQPDAFLRRIAELATDDAFIFVTTCINAPAIDHIYLWRTTDELEQMITDCGLDIVTPLRLPYEDMTLAESAQRALPINVAYVLHARRSVDHAQA